MPDYSEEIACGGHFVAGVDEVGRGPLAGPVIAAAVIFKKRIPEHISDLFDDSKKLSLSRRLKAFAAISSCRDIVMGIGAASVKEIDSLNIFQASLLAMQRAVRKLPIQPDHVLVDGKFSPSFQCPSTCLVKGDSRSFSIAAASIIAKVVRDRLMVKLAQRWSHYGWDKNMGYGTVHHRTALRHFGPTIHHRFSFAPVRDVAALVYTQKGAAMQLDLV